MLSLLSLLYYKLLSSNNFHFKYIKVDTATRWTFRHSLMLLWFADLMNVIEEVTIHRPNVSTPLSSAFIRGDLNAETRGPSRSRVVQVGPTFSCTSLPEFGMAHQPQIFIRHFFRPYFFLCKRSCLKAGAACCPGFCSHS